MKPTQTKLSEFTRSSGADSSETTPVVQSTPNTTPVGETVLLTDGGKTIPSYEVASENLTLLREYSADGVLKVFRDGKDHFVYLRSTEPAHRRTLRQDAERSTPDVGEQLWSIPDNWELQYHDRLDYGGRYRVYAIQGSDCSVSVHVPENCQIRDAWFRVEAVGNLVVEYNGNFSKEVVEDTLPAWRGRDHVPGSRGDVNADRIIAALERLVDRWDDFESTSLEWFETEARDTFEECVDDPDTLSLRDGALQLDIDFSEVSYIIEDICGVDHDVAVEVTRVLMECEALSVHPPAQVRLV